MGLTIADIIHSIERICPSFLAEEWDNVGLQVGDKDWTVNKIHVALEPSTLVVNNACKDNADLLITHHPLLFKPLSSIDFSTPVGSIIKSALNHRLAIISLHTNLDTVKGGVNDILSDRIGLKNLSVLGDKRGSLRCNLVLYIPPELKNSVLKVLQYKKIGIDEDVHLCSFQNEVSPLFDEEYLNNVDLREKSNPPLKGKIKFEFPIDHKDIDAIISEIRLLQSERPIGYFVYPHHPMLYDQGLGRVGELKKQTTLKNLSREIKADLNLNSVKYAGNPLLPVKRVAVCSGSGSSLLSRFLSSGADVYISGDLKYHDALIAAERGLGIIDIGHFGSEYLVVKELVEKLQKIFFRNNKKLEIKASELEKDPFFYI